MKFLTVLALSVSGLAVALAVQSSREMPRSLSVGDCALRVRVTGQGSPAVVFDTFGPAQLEIWNGVQKEVSRFARSFSYDHAGYWGSKPGPRPRDARQIASELHAALAGARVHPPYILVGYSFGGPYMRVFAGMYPQEVAGMVLIDPTQETFMDWFREAFPDFNQISERHIVADDELANSRRSLEQARAARLPSVPIALITGMKPHDLMTRHVLPRWLASHQAWLAQFPEARHIVTTNSGHEVVLSDPKLVGETIRDVVEMARRR